MLRALSTQSVKGAVIMKSGIHPNLHKVKFVCACGASFDSESTLPGDVYKCDICKECHPVFTGATNKTVSIGGRLDKFNKRINNENKK